MTSACGRPLTKQSNGRTAKSTCNNQSRHWEPVRLMNPLNPSSLVYSSSRDFLLVDLLRSHKRIYVLFSTEDLSSIIKLFKTKWTFHSSKVSNVKICCFSWCFLLLHFSGGLRENGLKSQLLVLTSNMRSVHQLCCRWIETFIHCTGH